MIKVSQLFSCKLLLKFIEKLVDIVLNLCVNSFIVYRSPFSVEIIKVFFVLGSLPMGIVSKEKLSSGKIPQLAPCPKRSSNNVCYVQDW